MIGEWGYFNDYNGGQGGSRKWQMTEKSLYLHFGMSYRSQRDHFENVIKPVKVK